MPRQPLSAAPLVAPLWPPRGARPCAPFVASCGPLRYPLVRAGPNGLPFFFVDAPFGAPSQHVFNYKATAAAITLIAIGITLIATGIALIAIVMAMIAVN